jgi:hypothetical protein
VLGEKEKKKMSKINEKVQRVFNSADCTDLQPG